MFQIQIIGNLTKDAEIRQSQKGDNFLSFTIAVNDAKDKPATFVRCLRKAYENTQNFAQHLLKGKKIYVQGALQVSAFNDQTGNARPDITCFVERIELLSSKTDEHQQTTTSTQIAETYERTNRNAATLTDDSDTLPF